MMELIIPLTVNLVHNNEDARLDDGDDDDHDNDDHDHHHLGGDNELPPTDA